MSYPTSLRLTKEGKQALTWLREQTGGFNLNQAVSRWLVEEAQKRKKS